MGLSCSQHSSRVNIRQNYELPLRLHVVVALIDAPQALPDVLSHAIAQSERQAGGRCFEGLKVLLAQDDIVGPAGGFVFLKNHEAPLPHIVGFAILQSDREAVGIDGLKLRH